VARNRARARPDTKVDIPSTFSKMAAFFTTKVLLMADDIDLANDLIDNEVSRALSRLRGQASADSKGSETCLECGDDMPKERQALGFKLCVPCAVESERRRSLFID